MKKKISKLFAVLLSIVILFTQATPVLAALTEGNRYSFSTRYLDAYYDTGTWETANGHTHDNYGQVALRNLSNGEPLYCIQIYNAVDSSAATAETITGTSLWRNELTSTAREGITRVSIYGYPNYTYGYSAQNAQLATQVLIWEFEIGRRTGFEVTTTAFARNIFSNYPNAQNCYLAILEACSNHQSRPSFNGTTVTLKGTGSSNAVTLTDTRGVLSHYNIRSVTNSRIKASKSGNKLTVYCTGTGALSGRIILTKANTNTNSALALTGANQVLFYGTIADPVNSPINVELSLGSITVHKKSEDGDHACEFIIKGNGINRTIKTNSEGLYTLSNLPEGTYTVTEVNRDKYYPHTEAKTVTVTAGKNSNVYFNNLLVKGKITVYKYGEILSTITENEDGTYTPVYENAFLPNAEYLVYAAEDIVIGDIKVAKNTLVDTIVTDKNGKATTTDLYLKENGTAKYKLVESKSPEGYVRDTKEHIVTLTKKGASVDVSSSLEAYNTRQKVRISFDKILECDELFGLGNNGEIEKIKFGLYASEKIPAADGTYIPAGALIETMSYDEIKEVISETENTETSDTQESEATNTDNSDTSNDQDTDTATDDEKTSKLIASYSVKTDLPFGSYYIREISTGEHYVIDDTKHTFTFSYTNQNEATVNIRINNNNKIVNMLKRGKLEGMKFDDSNNPLSGATIGLFSANTEEFTKETALITTISAEDGTFFFTDIPFGSYIVKELEAPEDYLIDPNNYPIEITENEQVVTLKIIDVLKRGDINGVKTDDSGNALQGALIGLFSADTTEFTIDTALMTTTSTEDGAFRFNDIPVGSYIVKELEAPDDYLIDPNNYPVEITENEQVVTLKIVDILKRGDIHGMKIDNNGDALEGALIGLFPAETTEFTKDTALMTATSSEDGSFYFNDIPVGAYIVREIEAPEGYILDDKSHEVNITDDGQIIELKIVNVMKIGMLSLIHNYLSSPKTGADYMIFATALGAACIAAVTVIICIAKKRKVRK